MISGIKLHSLKVEIYFSLNIFNFMGINTSLGRISIYYKNIVMSSFKCITQSLCKISGYTYILYNGLQAVFDIAFIFVTISIYLLIQYASILL